MTNENIIPANTPNDIELKHLVETSFFAMAHELEDHLTRGWRIHPDQAPVDTFVTKEVWLYKDRASINRTKNRIDEVLEARGEQNRETASENIQKARVARKAKSEERKSGPAVQDMMASLEGGKDEGAV